jgi:hypothetical protein
VHFIAPLPSHLNGGFVAIHGGNVDILIFDFASRGHVFAVYYPRRSRSSPYPALGLGLLALAAGVLACESFLYLSLSREFARKFAQNSLLLVVQSFNPPRKKLQKTNKPRPKRRDGAQQQGGLIQE